jgi:fibronectin-binding autotransporter adhesin
MKSTGIRLVALGALASIALAFAAAANAGTPYYWYGDDSTLGGAGTWDTTVTSWSGSSDTYSGVAWPNTTDTDAYFGTSAGTPTVSGNVTLGSITFGVANCNVSAGTLGIAGGINGAGVTGCTISSVINLLTAQTWNVDTGGTLYASGSITGTGGITKTGAGILYLSISGGTVAQSDFSGGFTLQEGRVRYYNAKSFGTGPLTLSGGTLETYTDQGIGNTVVVADGKETTLYSRTGSATNTLGLGTVTGGGTLTLNTAGSRGLSPNNWSGFTGTLRDITATVDTENSTHIRSVNGGSALATYILDGAGAHLRARWTGDSVTFTTYTVSLGALAGAATGAYLDNRSTMGNVIFSIGALGVDTTYAGHIYDRNSAYGSGSITGLLKTGTATLTLTGSCKFSGGATVEDGMLVITNSLGTTSVTTTSGTLQIGDGNASGTVGGAILNNATLVFNRNDLYTHTGVISGTGSVAVTGGGTLTLTGANTFSGTATIYSGGVQIGSGGANGALPGAVDMNGSTALVFNRAGEYSHTGAITGSGAVLQIGSGTTTLSNTNTYSGATTVSAGVLRVTGSIVNSNVTVSGSVSLLVAAGGAVSSSISVNGYGLTALTGGSVGTVYLNSNAVLAGYGTAGSVGTDYLGIIGSAADSALWGGQLVVGSLNLAGLNTLNFGNLSAYTSTAAIDVTGSGSFTAGGMINIGLCGTAPVGTGTVNLIRYSGSIVGSPTFVISNPGFGGSRAAYSIGTVTVGSAHSITLAYGIDYPYWTGAGDGVWTTATQSPKNWKLVSKGTVTDYIDGDAVLFDDRVNSGSTTFSATVTLGANVSPAGVTFNNSSSVSYTVTNGGASYGIVSGSLVKTGSGTVTLLNANSYSGSTTISDGVLSFASSALGSGQILMDGGTLQWNGTNSDDVSSRLAIANGKVANLDVGGNTVTFGTSIAGNVGLAKSGSGTLILPANNTYIGTTTVNAGALLITGDNATGAVTVNGGTFQIGDGGTGGSISCDIANNGSVVFKRSDACTFANVISGTGSVSKAGAGTLTISGSNSFSGGFAMQEGLVCYSSNYSFGTGQLSLSGGTLQTLTPSVIASSVSVYVADATNTTIYNHATSSENYSGGFSGEVTGGGTLTLFADNARGMFLSHCSGFTGTILDLGTQPGNTEEGVVLRNADGGSAQATFILNGAGAKIRTRGLVGANTVSLGAVAGTSTSAYIDNRDESATMYSVGALGVDTTYAGHIYDHVSGFDSTATVGIIKTGTGTWTLTGSSKYSGGTRVDAGVLAYGVDNATSLNRALTVNGGTVDLGAHSGTSSAVTLNSGVITGAGTLTSTAGFTVSSGQISAVLAGAVGLTKTTAGTVTLSAGNVYTGTTAVNGGMLVIQSDAATAAIFSGSTDIAAGKLVFDYSAGGSATGSTISDQVKSILTTSYNGGTNSWATGAIHSTLANSHSTDSYALGWSNNTTTGAVTVQVVLYGDATMDGTVNIYDLGQVLANYNKSGVWDTGDFNYDGTVNIYDLGTVLANYNKSLSLSEVSVNPSDYAGLDGDGVAALQAAGVNVVPEPGTLALLAAGAIGLVAYARRRRR